MTMDVTVSAPQVVDLRVSGDGGATLRVDRSRGTSHYPALTDKPSIEGHVLVGDSTIQQIGVGTLTVQEIEKILYRIP